MDQSREGLAEDDIRYRRCHLSRTYDGQADSTVALLCMQSAESTIHVAV